MFGDSPPGKQSTVDGGPTRGARERTVLFVGTEPIPPDTVSDSFEDYPVTVDVVTDGEQAIERLTETAASTDDGVPDLIVLGGGFESPDWTTLLNAIKSSPRLEPVPTVVVTADETDATIVTEHGGNAHVTAPECRDACADLLGSFSRFWFEWAQFPSESLSADNL
jgi:CheY-like chemotaxis protein